MKGEVVPDERVRYFLDDLKKAITAYDKDGPFFPGQGPDPKLAKHTRIFEGLRERARELSLNFPAETAKLREALTRKE